MKLLPIFFLPSLLWSQSATAQWIAPKGKLVVNAKLVSRFVKQTSSLRKAAIAQHFKKKTEPVPDWLMPEPRDKLVTYYQLGDTLVFYQSGRTATLLGCTLTNTARFVPTVPFLASTKASLFAGRFKTYNVLKVTDAVSSEQCTLILTFQNNLIRRLVFNLDTSSF